MIKGSRNIHNHTVTMYGTKVLKSPEIKDKNRLDITMLTNPGFFFSKDFPIRLTGLMKNPLITKVDSQAMKIKSHGC